MWRTGDRFLLHGDKETQRVENLARILKIDKNGRRPDRCSRSNRRKLMTTPRTERSESSRPGFKMIIGRRGQRTERASDACRDAEGEAGVRKKSHNVVQQVRQLLPSMEKVKKGRPLPLHRQSASNKERVH